MAIRISTLSRKVNMDISSLTELLKLLGYHEYDANPYTKIPIDIASTVLACVYNDNIELINIITKEYYSEIFRGDNNSKLKVVGFLEGFDNTHSFNKKQKNNIDEIKSNIDFSNLSSLQNSDESRQSFIIDELYILNPSRIVESIEVSDFTTSTSSKKTFYSVFIGANGVGKSSLLSNIVDFFLELHECSKNPFYAKTPYKGNLIGVSYRIDGQNYFVIRIGKICIAKVNGKLCALKYLQLPLIVACHFGAFEKFHYQSVNGKGQTKYDVPYYKYVGAHVNGNVISSSSIAFRLLFTLSTQINEKQVKNICSVLDFIEYRHTISLQYTLTLKSRRSNDAYECIKQRINKDKEYANLTQQERQRKINQLYKFYNDKKISESAQHLFELNFDDELSLNNYYELQCIYKLKQCNLISSSKVLFRKKNELISSEEMSSGEFTILATILSISASTNEPHTLVLLDEPEISQHPNWQMSLIENLDKALNKQSCHLLIATHSHLIVSDLPMKRSSVIQLKKDQSGNISSELLNTSTFGWSAEEVLLKVFKTATDRNRYLGERIADLIEKIGKNAIDPQNVTHELIELQEVSKHLSDIDPMKSVINTIIKTYRR